MLRLFLCGPCGILSEPVMSLLLTQMDPPLARTEDFRLLTNHNVYQVTRMSAVVCCCCKSKLIKDRSTSTDEKRYYCMQSHWFFETLASKREGPLYLTPRAASDDDYRSAVGNGEEELEHFSWENLYCVWTVVFLWRDAVLLILLRVAENPTMVKDCFYVSMSRSMSREHAATRSPLNPIRVVEDITENAESRMLMSTLHVGTPVLVDPLNQQNYEVRH